ncbi:MAG: response regulator [Acidobacteriota bacterium]
MKKNILFVDDDPQLLTALKRMLWNRKDAWNLSFVDSGDAALKLLAEKPHDVIVADMRMPGMDGRRLLRTVRKHYPWMMRLVLSGDSDLHHIMRTVPESHQFMTKPVSAQQLIQVIDRGCRLRDMILSEEMRHIIGQIDALPALPDIYTRLTRMLEDETAPVEAVTAVIGKDMALSADILKLVNSSFFGPRIRVRGLDQAVTLLGLKTIKGLVLGVQLFSVFDTRRIPDFSFPKLWEHSLNTAKLARRIAQLEALSPEAQDDCFIAGMLHDLGKFVLADKLASEYRALVARSRKENLSIFQAESSGFGTGHAQAGAYLLGLWGISDAVLEAVAFHHTPSALGLTAMSPVTAVHVANVLEHEFVVINPSYAPHVMDMDHLEQAGLTGRLETWKQACREALESGGNA